MSTEWKPGHQRVTAPLLPSLDHQAAVLLAHKCRTEPSVSKFTWLRVPRCLGPQRPAPHTETTPQEVREAWGMTSGPWHFQLP